MEEYIQAQLGQAQLTYRVRPVAASQSVGRNATGCVQGRRRRQGRRAHRQHQIFVGIVDVFYVIL